MTTVQTVTGPVDGADLGRTLVHEHIRISYDGEELDPTYAWDRAETVERAVDKMGELLDAGFRTFVDPCPIELGRDPELYAEISSRSGMQHRVHHRLLHRAPRVGPAVLLAGPRPGGDRRALRAGARRGHRRAPVASAPARSRRRPAPRSPPPSRAASPAPRSRSARSGCAIITHTENSKHGDVQQDLFADGGADLGRVLIGHQDEQTDVAPIRKLAERGTFVGVDRIGLEILAPDERRADHVATLVREGFTDQVCLSQDHICALTAPRSSFWVPPEHRDGGGDAPRGDRVAGVAAAVHLHRHRLRAPAPRARRHRRRRRDDLRRQPAAVARRRLTRQGSGWPGMGTPCPWPPIRSELALSPCSATASTAPPSSRSPRCSRSMAPTEPPWARSRRRSRPSSASATRRSGCWPSAFAIVGALAIFPIGILTDRARRDHHPRGLHRHLVPGHGRRRGGDVVRGALRRPHHASVCIERGRRSAGHVARRRPLPGRCARARARLGEERRAGRRRGWGSWWRAWSVALTSWRGVFVVLGPHGLWSVGWVVARVPEPRRGGENDLPGTDGARHRRARRTCRARRGAGRRTQRGASILEGDLSELPLAPGDRVRVPRPDGGDDHRRVGPRRRLLHRAAGVRRAVPGRPVRHLRLGGVDPHPAGRRGWFRRCARGRALGDLLIERGVLTGRIHIGVVELSRGRDHVGAGVPGVVARRGPAVPRGGGCIADRAHRAARGGAARRRAPAAAGPGRECPHDRPGRRAGGGTAAVRPTLECAGRRWRRRGAARVPSCYCRCSVRARSSS